MLQNKNMESSGQTILSKRIHKVLELRLENDKDSLNALKELSLFLHDNTAANRRNLQSIIESRTIAINSQFLTSLQKVEQTLDSIHKDVTAMSDTITVMRTQLIDTKSKACSLMDKTTKLQKDVQAVSNKQQIADSFIERFQLTPAEIAAFWSNAVGPDLFLALEKTEEIEASCKLLTQVGCQTVAADILQQMSMYQDVGMERLFRWAQSRCRTIDTPDPYGLLPQAIAKLHVRPQLFDTLLEEYTTNRRDILVRQFIDALTRGGRPIELRATEPKRYVGDMLAWLHQAVPAERDNLNYMLRNCENLDISEKVQAALGNINEGVCHPLKVRVEHILLGEDNCRDPVLLHSILNLLRYYKIKMDQVVGSDQLDSTLSELVGIADKTFLLSLQNRVSLLLGAAVDSRPGELMPSSAVGKILALLGQLLSADGAADGRQAHFSQVVSCVVDPLMQHVTEAAVKLPPAEMSVFLLNSFHTIQVALALYPFLDDRLEQLKAQCEAQLDTLTSEQASSLVAHLGLGAIYTILQGPPQKPLALLPAMDPSHITACSAKLDKFLATPDLYQLPHLALLASNNHRVCVSKRANSVVLEVYRDLYKAVQDPNNNYCNPQQLLPVPPDKMAATLAC